MNDDTKQTLIEAADAHLSDECIDAYLVPFKHNGKQVIVACGSIEMLRKLLDAWEGK